MLPGNRVEDEAHCGVTIETPGFYAALRRRRGSATHRTVIARLEPGVAVLASGERIASRHRSSTPPATALGCRFCSADVAAPRCSTPTACLRLYRNVLAPDTAVARLRRLQLRDRLAAGRRGRRALAGGVLVGAHAPCPTPATMHARIAAELRWRLERWPESTRALRNASVGLQFGYMEGAAARDGPPAEGARAARRRARAAAGRLRGAAGP